jgi:hypothetical protein
MKGMQAVLHHTESTKWWSIYCRHTLKTVMALSVRLQPIANKTTRPSIHDSCGSRIVTAAG